jgi:Met-10+ like-protein
MSMRFGPGPHHASIPSRIREVSENLLIWSRRILTPNFKITGATTKGFTGLRLPYNGRTIILHGGRIFGDASGVFGSEQYSWLPVAGKSVVDVGASVGDSPIYFRLNKASQVYALEPNPLAWAYMTWNLRTNRIDGVLPICKVVKNLEFTTRLPGPLVLKMDCEGAEVPILEATPPTAMSRITHAIVEYHQGSRRVEEILGNLGFKIISKQASASDSFEEIGVLCAQRSETLSPTSPNAPF